MEDGVDLSGDDLQPVPAQHRLRVVAAVGEKPWRSRGDRALTDGRRLREHALDVDLVAPVPRLVDAPARRRQREPVQGAPAPSPDPDNPTDTPSYKGIVQFNLIVNTGHSHLMN